MKRKRFLDVTRLQKQQALANHMESQHTFQTLVKEAAALQEAENKERQHLRSMPWLWGQAHKFFSAQEQETKRLAQDLRDQKAILRQTSDALLAHAKRLRALEKLEDRLKVEQRKKALKKQESALEDSFNGRLLRTNAELHSDVL